MKMSQREMAFCFGVWRSVRRIVWDKNRERDRQIHKRKGRMRSREGGQQLFMLILTMSKTPDLQPTRPAALWPLYPPHP